MYCIVEKRSSEVYGQSETPLEQRKERIDGENEENAKERKTREMKGGMYEEEEEECMWRIMGRKGRGSRGRAKVEEAEMN